MPREWPRVPKEGMAGATKVVEGQMAYDVINIMKWSALNWERSLVVNSSGVWVNGMTAVLFHRFVSPLTRRLHRPWTLSVELAFELGRSSAVISPRSMQCTGPTTPGESVLDVKAAMPFTHRILQCLSRTASLCSPACVCVCVFWEDACPCNITEAWHEENPLFPYM